MSAPVIGIPPRLDGEETQKASRYNYQNPMSVPHRLGLEHIACCCSSILRWIITATALVELSLFHALPTGMHACRSHFIIITPYLMLRAEYRANIYIFSSLLLPKLQ